MQLPPWHDERSSRGMRGRPNRNEKSRDHLGETAGDGGPDEAALSGGCGCRSRTNCPASWAGYPRGADGGRRYRPTPCYARGTLKEAIKGRLKFPVPQVRSEAPSFYYGTNDPVLEHDPKKRKSSCESIFSRLRFYLSERCSSKKRVATPAGFPEWRASQRLHRSKSIAHCPR